MAGISDLKNKIEGKLSCLLPLSPDCCIYRAPRRLRLGNEKSYIPKVVAIGPLHHRREELQAMEEHKRRYLDFLIQKRNLSLKDCVDVVKQNEKKLRDCYAEAIEFSSEELCEIILVDATFIIAFLLRFEFDELRDDHDRIFGKPWMRLDIWLDMLLLENQLPFFILCDLFKYLPTVRSKTGEVSISNLSLGFVKAIMHLEIDTENWATAGTKHFVDLLRRLYLNEQGGGGNEQGGGNGQGGEEQGGGRNEQGGGGNGQGGGGNGQVGGGNGQGGDKQGGGEKATPPMPSITELSLAGATFNVGSGKNLLGLKFENGVLEIPKLIISEETETLLRNVLAFEQCYYEKYRINEYVFIMNRLVNSQKDVEIMVKYGIVENRLANSKRGSFLMNNLIDGVSVDFDEMYFARLCEDMDKYYKNSWRKWMVDLRQKHFKTPWTIISLFAGATLLILTFIQTVYSTRSSKWT